MDIQGLTLKEFIEQYVIYKFSETDKTIARYRSLDVFGYGVNEKTYQEIAKIIKRSTGGVGIRVHKLQWIVQHRIANIANGLSHPHVVVKEVEKGSFNRGTPMIKKSLYDILVFDEPGLAVRIVNCLRAKEIETIEDLLKTDKCELLKVPNFGRKCFNLVQEKLNYHGLKMGQI